MVVLGVVVVIPLTLEMEKLDKEMMVDTPQMVLIHLTNLVVVAVVLVRLVQTELVQTMLVKVVTEHHLVSQVQV